MASKSTVKTLRMLVETNGAAHAIFGWLSEYTNDAHSSPVELFEKKATQWGRENIDDTMVVTRQEAITIMKQLDALKLGRFIVGRRESKTRFEFWTPRTHIGQAAMGEIDDIDIHEEEVALDNERIIEMHRVLLANVLELPLRAVRIKIKE